MFTSTDIFGQGSGSFFDIFT